MVLRVFKCLVLGAIVAALSGCMPSPRASLDDIARFAYSHTAEPSVTLITVKKPKSGSGHHSALIINGSQRVIFDPGGTFVHRQVPERGDVIYGVTPQLLDIYIDYHSRVTFFTVAQTRPVPPEVAERLLKAVQENGPAPSGFCNQAVSNILRNDPYFNDITVSFFPRKTEAEFARYAGVKRQEFYDDDPDDNSIVLENINLN